MTLDLTNNEWVYLWSLLHHRRASMEDKLATDPSAMTTSDTNELHTSAQIITKMENINAQVS